MLDPTEASENGPVEPSSGSVLEDIKKEHSSLEPADYSTKNESVEADASEIKDIRPGAIH